MRKFLGFTGTMLALLTLISYIKVGESQWRNNFALAVMVHYPWDRIKGYQRFYSYWQGYMRQLRYDPESRVYSFKPQIDTAKAVEDFWNAGLLEFHQGMWDQSIVDLDTVNRGDEEYFFWRAMAYFRRGMNARCLARSKDLSRTSSVRPQCALPIKLNIKSKNKDLNKAKALFKKLVDLKTNRNSRYRWLLNLCAIFNGENPNSIKSKGRINGDLIESLASPQSRVESEIQLVNRAREFGIDNFDAGKGVAVEDFDGDGHLDIVTGGFYETTRFYRNHRGKRFADRSVELGLDEIKGAHIITAADYNNDGWIDLFISHPTGTQPYGGFSLLRNDKGRRFVDVTFQSGLLTRKKMLNHGAFTWTSAWGDVDNDGDLDLFVANWGGKHLINGKPALDSSLYLNHHGRFKDVSEAFGLALQLKNNLIVGAAFGDYDGDGYADLALASMLPGFPVLFKNLKGQRFQAEKWVRTDNDGGFTIAFADLNHDGRLDLFRGVAMLPDPNIENVVITNKSPDHGHSLVWLQQANGTFELDEGFFRNDWPMASMGANFGDLNNDGAYDFYLGSGGPQPWFLLPNVLYLGTLKGTRPTSTLINITLSNGVGTLAKGHGIVFFDYDNDGDQDIYSSLGGMWPGDRWPNEFFVNETRTDNAWIKLRLRGRKANHYGLGAMIRVRAKTTTGEPILRYYLMDNKTGFGSAPYIAHIGLADASHLTDVAVKWPGDTRYVYYSGKFGTLNILDQAE